MRATIGLVVAASLVSLTACTGLSARNRTTQDDSTDGITISSLRPAMTAALKPYYAQKLVWTRCANRMLCSTVKAPVDWSDVTAESISLALVKHVATAGKSLGAILVDPGGPGGSGVELVQGSVDDAVDSRVANDFDIIGFDPRGVGKSTAVKCFNDAGMDAYLYGIDPGTVGSKVWIAAEEKKSRDLAAACEKGTGPVLAHLDTINAANDMDVIRAALGEKKLNYLGYSYGSYLGTIYAGLYPHRVGRMVFDGADDPWGNDYDPDTANDSSIPYGVDPADDGTVAQAVGFESDLNAYLKSCLANDATAVGNHRCPFTGSLRSAQSRVAGFLASAAKHPFVGAKGRELGAFALALGIEDPLYDPSGWPDLTKLFTQIEVGNPAEAFALADDYNDRNSNGTYDDNSDLANLAIGCLEQGPSVDIPYDKREAAELRKLAPILGIYQAYGDLVCSGWKYGPSPFPNPVHAPGTGPILVLGTTGDPATPYADAQSLAGQLDGGHLITLHAEGHTAYDLGDYCIDDVVDDYFIYGTVPNTDPECR